MAFLLVVGIFILPVLMLLTERLVQYARITMDLLAVVCAICFGIITALSVYDIRRHHTIFMTDIHKVFDNWLYLITGSYLGLYGIARLIAFAARRVRDD
jgi:hypothetical protein